MGKCDLLNSEHLWPDGFGYLSENCSQVLQQIPAEEGTRTGILCGTGSAMRIIFTCCTDYVELRLEGSLQVKNTRCGTSAGSDGKTRAGARGVVMWCSHTEGGV